ncbi:MAG: hypothetical protein ABIR37_03840 [Candidatus Saccharimonadales bacterium]
MEFHPFENIKTAPGRVRDAIHELRLIVRGETTAELLGEATTEPTNEEQARAEMSSFYSSRHGRNVPAMTAGLRDTKREISKNKKS